MKIELTEKQKKYLIRHFPNTRNEDLAAHLGLSQRTMIRRATELGLRKTKQFMNKCHRNGLQRAHEVNEADDYKELRKRAIEQHRVWREEHPGEPYPGTFRPGTTNLQRLGKRKERQRIEKMKKTRKELIERDRRRIRMGLEPLTNLLPSNPASKQKIELRSYMKHKYGYMPVFRNTDIIYYSDDTRRNDSIEREARSYGIRIVDIKTMAV